MANKEINDLTAAVSLSLTDNFEIQQLAGLSKKVSSQSIVDLVIDNLTSSTRILYVASTGSDITGNGTELNPWATLQYAYSQISATVNNRYQIQVVPGTYTWPTVSIKPFIYVNFNNSVISITNPVTLDASWSAVNQGNFFWENIHLSSFGLSLDFQSVGALGGIALFQNVSFNNLFTHTITGSIADSTFLYFYNFSLLAPTANVVINDCYGYFFNGLINSFTHNSNNINANFSVKNVKSISNFTKLMALAGGNSTFEMDSCVIEGILTLSNTANGTLNAYKTNTIVKGTEVYLNTGGGVHIPHVDYRVSDSSKSVGMKVLSLNPINAWGKFAVYGEFIGATSILAGPTFYGLNLSGATYSSNYQEMGIDINTTTGVVTNNTGRDGFF